jgi:glycosyltransferase involved in cell wall biosynthesis
MKVAWVTRSFLDYRIPVYEALSKRLGDNLTVIYNTDYVPDRCCTKIRRVLGPRAKGLRGELALKWARADGFTNQGLRIPYQKGLIKTVLRQQPDVLISDGFFQWTYAALYIRATRGIPHVMCYEKTCHTERNAQWYRTVYRRFAMRWIDAMCCNGTLCGQYTESLGFPADRITFGHMVADVEGLRRNADAVTAEQIHDLRLRLRLGGLVFLYVGRLIRLKGLQELLAAWSRFTGTVGNDNATLLIVGDGPQKGELERICEREGLSNVRFAGAVDYDGLAVYYRSADVFVIPTLEDNWSLVVSEAMACGLPIMCSIYNGCWPELVSRENGWTFDPLDTNQTLSALTEVLVARVRLTAMGRASERIVASHTSATAARQIVRACEIAYERCRRSAGALVRPERREEMSHVR